MDEYYAKVREEAEKLIADEKKHIEKSGELTRQGTKDIMCLLGIMRDMEFLRMVDGLQESHSNDYNRSIRTDSERTAADKTNVVKAKNTSIDDAEMYREWPKHMKNADGTTGLHWTVAQTTSFAEARDVSIRPELWCLAMNMMYSDYYRTAKKNGVNNPDFYADLAYDFLMDPDGGGAEKKLKEYYCAIVA